MAAAAFENTFAVPTCDGTVAPLADSLRVILEVSGAITVEEEVRKKFVGKLNPSPGLWGKPERQRPAPVLSHPPITASTNRLAEFAKRRPLPKGRSKTMKPLKLWLRSKSETARLRPTSNGFWISPCTVPFETLGLSKSLFSAAESLSMDLEKT